MYTVTTKNRGKSWNLGPSVLTHAHLGLLKFSAFWKFPVRNTARERLQEQERRDLSFLLARTNWCIIYWTISLYIYIYNIIYFFSLPVLNSTWCHCICSALPTAEDHANGAGPQLFSVSKTQQQDVQCSKTAASWWSKRAVFWWSKLLNCCWFGSPWWSQAIQAIQVTSPPSPWTPRLPLCQPEAVVQLDDPKGLHSFEKQQELNIQLVITMYIYNMRIYIYIMCVCTWKSWHDDPQWPKSCLSHSGWLHPAALGQASPFRIAPPRCRGSTSWTTWLGGTVGKECLVPWENHRKMVVEWDFIWFYGCFSLWYWATYWKLWFIVDGSIEHGDFR